MRAGDPQKTFKSVPLIISQALIARAPPRAMGIAAAVIAAQFALYNSCQSRS